MNKKSTQQEATNISQELESVKRRIELLSTRKRKDLQVWERVQLLQLKLYLKAKETKDYKFYVLYDKIFLDYILQVSWLRVRQNGGTSGVDGVSFADIEQQGVKHFLGDLKESLRQQTYRPSPVKRVEIPKSNGKLRPLGIPTIRDRVAQMACKLVIEPIFESDFAAHSYGFRPRRSASDAIKEIKEGLQSGQTSIYDADLSKYFDKIPHDKLEIALRERITDKRVIDLIKKWLKAPVHKDRKDIGGKRNKVGTPQGGVISPLLSNIYLNLLDRIVVHPKSIFSQAGIRMVRYADDFILMGQKIPKAVKEKLKELLNRMELEVNESKTKEVNAKQERFDFLGFTFSYDRDLYLPKTKRYWNIQPSKVSQQGIRDKIKTTLQKIGHYNPMQVAKELNRIQRGWLNYFDIPKVSYPQVSKRRLRFYLQERLNRYYNRKSQRRCRLYRQQAFEELVRKYGLIDPYKYKRPPH